MGVLDGVKRATRKTQLKGELVITNRRINGEKKKAGQLLFNVLFAWESMENREVDNLPIKGGNGKLPSIFMSAKSDMAGFVTKRQTKEEELEKAEQLLGETQSGPVATTAGEKTQKYKNWVAQKSKIAKLRAEINAVDHEMKLRKEAFGIEAYEELDLASLALNFESEQPIVETDTSKEKLDTPQSNASDEDIVAVLDQIKRNLRPLVQAKVDKERECMFL